MKQMNAPEMMLGTTPKEKWSALKDREQKKKNLGFMVVVCMCSAISNALQPHAHGSMPSARPLCPWDFLGKNTGEGCHLLLRGSSWAKDKPGVSCVSCIAGRFFTAEPPGKFYGCSNEVENVFVHGFWEGIQQWILTCGLIAAASATVQFCFLLSIWSMVRISVE